MKTSTMGIKEFFSGCSIFITGGSGFMGKVLIEKLLRSCPGIDTIYVLMRQGKQKDINVRIKEMLALPLFDKINEECPGMVEKKLIPVFGDLTEIKLGLSDDDYDTLINNVSIVFHVAATVRFNEPLRDAIIKNVRGTRDVVGLAKQMKKLKVFLHVSTTYCNCNRVNVEEKIYESPVSWQDAILIAENFDPKLADIFTTKFLGLFPNTYTLTKLMAEQIIYEESTQMFGNNMPMIIFRPSIVISSVKEPIIGWIDNVNGPSGLMVATGKGVALVTLAHKDESTDFMAVDYSIKAMIVAAYHRGTHNLLLDKQIEVYNSSSVNKDITNYKIMQLAVKYFMEHPFDEIFWRPRVYITSSKFLFNVLTIIQQVIPAILVDSLLKYTGKNSPVNLVKLQQKVYLSTMALSYFTLQTWTFNNSNFLNLNKCIPDSEKEDFEFTFDDIDTSDIFKKVLIGTQKYLFQTNPKQIMQAAKKLKKLVWLDRFLRTFFCIVLVWCLLRSNIIPGVSMTIFSRF